MKVFTIEEPVFKTEPLFIVGCTYEELCRYLKKRFRIALREDADCTTAGRMFTFACTPWRVVWCKEPHLGVLLHETFHLVTRICYDKGVQVRAYDARDDWQDETAAYLYEFFGSRAVRKLRSVLK